MSPLSNYFIISTALSVLTGATLYEIKQEKAEIEAALVQLHEQEVGLQEYTRELAYQIEDLRTQRHPKYSRAAQ